MYHFVSDAVKSVYTSDDTQITSHELVGWLVGFYGTAALYRLYSAGECSECENECACRVGGVVPPCTLEQWVNYPHPISLGVYAEFDGVKPFYTLEGSWHILSSP